jgi:hypothetical protein
MKRHQATVRRLFPAMLVAAAIISLSTMATRTPNQNQSFVGLKRIQTDRATTFYANNRQDRCWFVEAVLPETADGQAATENLKAVAATL